MNIPLSERIKNTSIKKASKPGNNIVKEDAPKLNLFQKENEPKEKQKEENNIKKVDNTSDIVKENNEEKKQEKDKDIKDNDINKETGDKIKLKIGDGKTNNPFSLLIKDDKNDKNENKSLFRNIFNKNEKKESLFSNMNNTASLFGIPINTDKKENNIFSTIDKIESKEQKASSNSIFGNNPLISKENNNNDKTISLFGNNSGKALFGNNENKSTNVIPTLFSNLINNNSKSSFLEIKGDTFAKSLFGNKTENKKNDSDKNGALFEDDDNSEKSDEQDKPKTNYVAEPLKAQDYSEYSKIFSLNINNLFLYNKAQKKYVSKGSGFFCIEKTKDDATEKAKVVVVFRNHAGNKLVEGFLDNEFKKCDILSKDFDSVVCFGIILINEGKPDIGFIKIPFKNEDSAKELKQAFDNAMKIIA